MQSSVALCTSIFSQSASINGAIFSRNRPDTSARYLRVIFFKGFSLSSVCNILCKHRKGSANASEMYASVQFQENSQKMESNNARSLEASKIIAIFSIALSFSGNIIFAGYFCI